MQRLFLLVLAVLVAGCAAPPPKEELAAPKPQPKVKIDKVDYERTSKVALVNDKGEFIKVGSLLDDVTKFFPKDNGAGFSDLHPALERSKFDAWGWEGKDGRSFGAILDRVDKRVALAMRTFKDQGQTQLDALVKQYEDLVGKRPSTVPPTIPGKSATYYFWDDHPHRLMICAVTNTRGGYNVVVAMGDAQVMDAIGASQKGAAEAIVKGDSYLQAKR